MGIQLLVKHSDMIAAGCTSTDMVETFWEQDQDGNEYRREFLYQVYSIPDLGEWRSYSPINFMVDFNHWGENRPKLMPWLEANQIMWAEI
jgi:hypothetical protein